AVLSEAQLHHEDELRSPGVGHRLVAEPLEEIRRRLERGRAMDLEGREPHARWGMNASSGWDSTSSAASTPSPTDTATPWSASPCPRAASATSGVSDRAFGPMWPSRKSRSLRSPKPGESMTP